ncbi:hypothetical protein SNE40_019977 [Patella caerulea]
MCGIKKVDCALLPPCEKTVYSKLQRAHFVSIIWGRADSADPGHGLDPLQFGWSKKNGCCSPEWFLGPAMPDNIFDDVDSGEDITDDLDGDHLDDGSNSDN